MKDTIILAIETSCDETAVAIIKNGKEVLANVVSTQIPTHQKFGGVVPEVASRKHLEMMNIVVSEALNKANLNFDDLTHIAVTYGPGLVGALLVGVSCAKALAFASDKPLIGVNHIEGHVYANFLVHKEINLPVICLIVSGGHTNIVKIVEHGKYEFIGQTRDDAAGEAFDKVARSLGLAYPGGPEIQKRAELGCKDAIDFPRSWLEAGSYDFSFSGLKSAVLNYLNQCKMKDIEINTENVAASFQSAVIEVLITKTINAALESEIDTILLAGGVSANSALREEMTLKAKEKGIKVLYPQIEFCTDNAAMIGAAAHYKAIRKEYADLDLNANPNLKFGV
ncbi:O-sialoglycoprotein endopeptidase [Desulfonispora thiosulfatigenes DSM 11270]|uniref:tRNA N6-adenosine threonylcarbamoyltransferase n=1 Tax=Desulfonispora thiosulfatigenes DSM 11270 TaxID=656914 RepID=A0A1W1V8X7_DESTI|nr:tRNA (adenosine(37)-N6)-threonylcarbamoyltransferase complex transferase subunit TsaD [Desulfonispora thiosulfatigenes]SMB89723.1 O-sialoglycoprotein endopeptidase [Desulfonispora thiosulfatigenes DSM 11270]